MKYSHNHSIFSIPERTFSDKAVLTNQENDRVSVSSEDVGENKTKYTVTGKIPLGRKAVAGLLGAPLGIADPDWKDTRKGLAMAGYGDRMKKALHLDGKEMALLAEVRPAARELADILRRNQSYRTETRNMPVFNWKTAYDYVVKDLFLNTDPRKVVSSLEKAHADPLVVAQLREILENPPKLLKKQIKELAAITGIDDREQRMNEISGMLSQNDDRVVVELIHQILDEMFVGFQEESDFVSGPLKGGSYDKTVQLRSVDVPENIRQSEYAIVSVGNPLMDRERLPWERKKDREGEKKKTAGLERRAVTFKTYSTEFVAFPRLSWVNESGRRRFVFPVGQFENMPLAPRVARPNSLAGAALAANYFGALNDIEYDKQLAQILRRRPAHAAQLPLAGFLPLVIQHRQEELLDDTYFASIEEAVK